MPTKEQIDLAQQHAQAISSAIGRADYNGASQAAGRLRTHLNEHLLKHYTATGRAIVEVHLRDLEGEVGACSGLVGAAAQGENPLRSYATKRVDNRVAAVISALRDLPHLEGGLELAAGGSPDDREPEPSINHEKIETALAEPAEPWTTTRAAPWLLRIAAIALAAVAAAVALHSIPSRGPADSAWPLALAWSSRVLAVGALVTAVHLLLRAAHDAAKLQLEHRRQSLRRGAAIAAPHLAKHPEVLKAVEGLLSLDTTKPDADATVPIPVEVLKELPKLVSSFRGGAEK